MMRLLEGSPTVLNLLEHNPFPDEPPVYVRARLYDYRVTAWKRSGLVVSSREGSCMPRLCRGGVRGRYWSFILHFPRFVFQFCGRPQNYQLPIM